MSIETNLIASTSSGSPTTVYTSSGESAITTIFFCNTDSSDIDITVKENSFKTISTTARREREKYSKDYTKNTNKQPPLYF